MDWVDVLMKTAAFIVACVVLYAAFILCNSK